ncbi:MAG: AbrB/MazE/SpoVT family DNA-binding domain-containing protein [Gammaproteobacteria bacterium]|nr:AbrB/MazE/SpoVT family DNA-binding domain-containing protein [Gammaproteobacteria bacterium]
MPIGSEFEKSRTKAVHVRKKGTDRIQLPAGHAWDSFFLEGSGVSKDFLAERSEQQQPDREPL